MKPTNYDEGFDEAILGAIIAILNMLSTAEAKRILAKASKRFQKE